MARTAGHAADRPLQYAVARARRAAQRAVA